MTSQTMTFKPERQNSGPQSKGRIPRAIVIGSETPSSSLVVKHLESESFQYDLAPLTQRFELIPERYAIGIVCYSSEHQSQASQAVEFLCAQSIPALAVVAAECRSLSGIARQSGAQESLCVPFKRRDFEDALDTVMYRREIAKYREAMPAYARMLAELSPREKRIIQLAAAGLPNKQIASTVGLSVKSIERIRREAYQKLNVRSIAEMTRVFLLGSMYSMFEAPSAAVAGPHFRLQSDREQIAPPPIAAPLATPTSTNALQL
ncbi:MAG: LuxR C-terminal-related transcriptional regulator [Pirellulaceae bacterium]